jgi:hypothetical protein
MSTHPRALTPPPESCCPDPGRSPLAEATPEVEAAVRRWFAISACLYANARTDAEPSLAWGRIAAQSELLALFDPIDHRTYVVDGVMVWASYTTRGRPYRVRCYPASLPTYANPRGYP